MQYLLFDAALLCSAIPFNTSTSHICPTHVAPSHSHPPPRAGLLSLCYRLRHIQAVPRLLVVTRTYRVAAKPSGCDNLRRPSLGRRLTPFGHAHPVPVPSHLQVYPHFQPCSIEAGRLLHHFIVIFPRRFSLRAWVLGLTSRGPESRHFPAAMCPFVICRH